MMKTAIAIFFAAALCCSVHATTCGNNSQGGGAPPCPVGGDSGGKKKCNDPDGPGSDPCTGSSVTPYTGNERHVVEDLKVWGSIGEQPLVWTRYYNSRAVISNNIFGNNQTWRHGYEWETSVAYDANGPYTIQLYYPSGVVNRFTRVGTTANYLSTPAVTDTVTLNDAGTFTLQGANGFQTVFKRVGVSSTWLAASFADSQQNITTFTYDTKNRLTKVTDAGGRFLQITYQQLSINNQNDVALAILGSTPPPEGQWTTLASTSSASFRYLRYRGPDRSYSSVAEIRFLSPGGATLSGTPFGSGADPVAGHDYSKAFDNDTSTFFLSSIPTYDYAGIDLGAAASVGAIQFFPRTGHAADMALGRFYGSNTAPASIAVISKVETNDGRSVTYDYTAFNDPGLTQSWQTLTAAHYGDGAAAAYTYVQAFPLTKPLLATANDPRVEGSATSLAWQYDNTMSNIVGYVVEEKNGTSGETILSIDSNNNRDSNITYANGGVTTFAMSHLTTLMDARTDSLGRRTTYVYDQGGYGFKIGMTDALNRTTSYARTNYGNLIGKTNPDASTESWTRDSLDLVLTHTDELGRVTAYTRDARHRVTRIDYPDGSFETFAYNGFSQVTGHQLRNGGTETSVYDARGLKTSMTDALGNVTAYTYNANDLVATATDALGHTTSFQYNERGLVTRIQNPDSSARTFTYDAYGNRIDTTNELGNTWTTDYDEWKRPVSVTDPLNRTTTYSYDLPGGGCGCSHGNAQPTKITLPSGKMTVITYDTEWQKTGETVGFGTSDAATTGYAYDSVGNVTGITDPRGKVWRRTYDSRNRPLTATDPLNHTTHYTYDAAGNKLTETRPDGGMTTNVYDAMNRLTRSTDPKNQATQFSYDSADNLITLTDARGNAYGYTYDLLNRKLAMAYPGSSSEQWSYDAAGNLAAYTARAGQVCTYTYDNRNRNTQSAWSDGVTPTATKTYDAASRLLTNNNGVSSLSYAYDATNQLLSETSAVAPTAPKTIGYTYDSDGNRASLTYPAGNTATYAYTGRNQVSSITVDGPPPVATYTYDLNGNRITKALENGTSAGYTYDDANRLTNLVHTLAGTSASFAYAYNSVNDRTSRAETSGTNAPVTDAYGYDAVDQVTGVNYGSGRNVAYAYDPTGNRMSVTYNGTATSYTANALNQYTAIGGLPALGYDGNGNLASGNGWTYTYDAQNRLITASGPSTTAAFAYDARNRCVSRTINGTATYFTYDGWNLIEDRSAPDTLLAYYINGATNDEPLEIVVSNVANFYLQDALGSTVRLTDGSGQVEESYTYDVFGAVAITDATSNPLATSAIGNRFMFTGREWLKELCLYDYRNRLYSADLGRFLQTDPLRFKAGDVNLYRYVGNSPVDLVDPKGLKCMLAIVPFHNFWDAGDEDGSYGTIVTVILVTGDDGTCPECRYDAGTMFFTPLHDLWPRARDEQWLREHWKIDINNPPNPYGRPMA
jgi:RHS repeat-associated protein